MERAKTLFNSLVNLISIVKEHKKMIEGIETGMDLQEYKERFRTIKLTLPMGTGKSTAIGMLIPQLVDVEKSRVLLVDSNKDFIKIQWKKMTEGLINKDNFTAESYKAITNACQTPYLDNFDYVIMENADQFIQEAKSVVNMTGNKETIYLILSKQ